MRSTTAVVVAMIIVTMPGKSFDGALPALSPEQTALRDNLRGHVEMLAGTIGERNLHHFAALEASARYIANFFESIGYGSNLQSFSVQGRTVSNIEVVKAGTERPDEIVVVGAHYDSVIGSPGANDNATGVAGILELARMLHSQRLARTVHFVAFVNEEPPYTYTNAMGSRRYAERAAEKGERITAMLSLETIGRYSDEDGSQHYPFPFDHFYPDRGNFIGFVGNLRSRDLVRRTVASFRSHAEFPSEGLAAPGWMTGIGWSDQWSFWKSGYPGIMVTDTALFRYAQYHSPADRPGIIVYDSFARVVHGLEGVIRDLANAE